MLIGFPVSELVEFPKNPKAHDVDAIEQSIDVNGWYGVLLVLDCPGEPNYILAGHGRKATLTRKGQHFVPAILVRCDMKTARRIVLVDNRSPESGGFNDRALTEFLRDITLEDGAEGLRGTGYDAMQLGALTFATRDSSEIADKKEAAEWVGLPEYQEGDVPLRAIIQFRSAKDRDAFAKLIGVPTSTAKVLSGWWPLREREDLSSVVVDEKPKHGRK